MWKNTGEYKIQKALSPYYEIYQFWRNGWIGLGNMGDEYAKLAKNALAFAQRITKDKKPNLLVLDEINLALQCQFVET